MYLVTGGGGFIGSHLVRALVKQGTRVRVLDNSSTGSQRLIADVLHEVEWIDGDVRDPDTVLRACRGVEVVFHQAAVASVSRSIAELKLTHDVNVTGSLNVLTAARYAGVRRLVLASSSAVYGDRPEGPKTEMSPARPLSPYGVEKLTAESYCRIWPALYGVETVALRYFNVFGPAQQMQGEDAAVIPRFISAVLAGQAPTVYGDGEQSRDFIYVSDVVHSNLLAAVIPEVTGIVINVGSGIGVTLNHLLALLGHISGRAIHPRYEPPRPGDIRESCADTALMRSALGYEPAISFSEGLALTLHWFIDNGPCFETASNQNARNV